MVQALTSHGLTALPEGLDDKDAALVTPIYRALNALNLRLNEAAGTLTYNAAEMASIDQLVGLIEANSMRIIVRADENLSYGQALNLFVAADKINARRADATILDRPCTAFCDTPEGIAAGSYGTVIFLRGRTRGISGSTFMAPYYLSIEGQVQITPPTASGVIAQMVGLGLGSAGFYVNINPAAAIPSYIYKSAATNLRVNYADGSFSNNSV